MSLLPRRDPSAVWAMKQRARSHFPLITTDCYLSFLPPLSSLPDFSPPLLQWLCFTDFLLQRWAQKNTMCALTNTQTIRRDACVPRLAFYAHTCLHKHRQNTARAQSALRSHAGHCDVTRRVSFCHPLINNGKILIRIFKCSPGKRFLSACYITHLRQNEPRARSISLFLDSIDGPLLMCTMQCNMHLCYDTSCDVFVYYSVCAPTIYSCLWVWQFDPLETWHISINA